MLPLWGDFRRGRGTSRCTFYEHEKLAREGALIRNKIIWLVNIKPLRSLYQALLQDTTWCMELYYFVQNAPKNHHHDGILPALNGNNFLKHGSTCASTISAMYSFVLWIQKIWWWHILTSVWKRYCSVCNGTIFISVNDRCNI